MFVFTLTQHMLYSRAEAEQCQQACSASVQKGHSLTSTHCWQIASSISILTRPNHIVTVRLRGIEMSAVFFHPSFQICTSAHGMMLHRFSLKVSFTFSSAGYPQKQQFLKTKGQRNYRFVNQ